MPTPPRRPFNSTAGNQTSNLMSESRDGVAMPATRQNAFNSGSGSPLGGLKVPASTSSALTMVVREIFALARFLQSSAGEAGKTQGAKHKRYPAPTISRILTIGGSTLPAGPTRYPPQPVAQLVPAELRGVRNAKTTAIINSAGTSPKRCPTCSGYTIDCAAMIRPAPPLDPKA